MKKQKILITLILLSFQSLAFSKNLNDFYSELENNNLDIKKSLTDLELSKLNYSSALISKNPDVSLSLSNNKSSNSNNVLNTSFGLSYNLDLWGKLKDNEKSKFLQIEVAKLNLNDVKKSTIMKFNDYYLQLAYNNEKLQLEKNKLNKMYEELNILNVQHNNDFILIDKIITLKNSILSTESSILSINDTKNNLINSLNSLLNVKTNNYFDEPIYLENFITLNNINNNLFESIQNNPTVQSSFLNIASYDYNVIYNQKSYYPIINFSPSISNSSYNLANLLTNPIGTLLSSVNFSFNRNEVKINIDISKVNKEQAQITYESTYTNIYNTVFENIKKYENISSNLKISNDTENQYKNLVNISKIQYEKGFSSYINLLEQELLLINSQESKLTYQLNQQQIINKLNYYLS